VTPRGIDTGSPGRRRAAPMPSARASPSRARSIAAADAGRTATSWRRRQTPRGPPRRGDSVGSGLTFVSTSEIPERWKHVESDRAIPIMAIGRSADAGARSSPAARLQSSSACCCTGGAGTERIEAMPVLSSAEPKNGRCVARSSFGTQAITRRPVPELRDQDEPGPL